MGNNDLAKIKQFPRTCHSLSITTRTRCARRRALVCIGKSIMPLSEEQSILARGLGLDGALKQLEGNPELAVSLSVLAAATGISPSPDGSLALPAGAPPANTLGTPLLFIVNNLSGDRVGRREFVARYVVAGRLATSAQVAAGVAYLKAKAPNANIDVADFETAAGVDIKWTEEDIKARVRVAWCAPSWRRAVRRAHSH
ncbi:hypothetical protein EON68_00005 [archaeon]|nr:MAG: hypothetical protein EON68_00005 [archaeon]